MNFKGKKPGTLNAFLFWAMLIAFVFLATLMVPRDRSQLYNYQVGDLIRQTVIAPYDFDILKPADQIDQEKDQIIKDTPQVFNNNTDVIKDQQGAITFFFQLARSVQLKYRQLQRTRDSRELYRYVQDRYPALVKEARSDSIAFEEAETTLNTQMGISVRDNPWKEIYLNSDDQALDLNDLEKNISTLTQSVYQNGISDIPKQEILSTRISISRDGEESIVSQSTIYDVAEASNTLIKQITALYPDLSLGKRQLISQLVPRFIKPNLIFDRERTTTRRNDGINRIPIVQGKVLKDEKIVDANTRITADIYQKLTSLNTETSLRYAQSFGWRFLIKFAGDYLIMSILVSILMIFLYIYDKKLLRDLKRMSLLLLVMLLILGIAFILVGMSKFPPVTVPIVVAALLITIFFGSQIAFISSLIILLILAYILGNHFQFILLHSLPVVTGIMIFRKLRTRDQIFMAMIWVFAAYCVTIAAIELPKYTGYHEILQMLYYALLNTIASILSTYSLVILFEKIYDLTTDMTLLELSDLNRPVLKELAIKAPGTYHHSVMVGNLAEAAAEAIGANSLLARVGAYYHDIGKISKAEYFIENQKSGDNKLNQLKPHMAAKVVLNHVREGLEMAEKYNIPKIISDFIPTHHGTTTVAYFYRIAMDQAENPASVDESDFRYHGPRPTTKETGILMLVEAMEAAVRSIDKPTQQAIQQMVTKLFKNRLAENQLDICPLTLAELDQIQNAVIPILSGMYHVRIAYPGSRKGEIKSAK